MNRRRILYFVTEDWYFVSHRLPLAIAAKKAGFAVSVVTNVNRHRDQIEKAGLHLIPIELSRRGSNPIAELKIVKKMISICKSEQPDIVHNVSLKPVIYGTIASLFVKKTHVVNALAGLGFIFSSRSLKARILRTITILFFRLLLNQRKNRVILQNPDDISMLRVQHVLKKDNIVLIRGSGVDPHKFYVSTEAPPPLVVMLASRLLWDKGVGEFVEAAHQLKCAGVQARFILVGSGDKENPTNIPDDQLKRWHDEGTIEWWGRRDDMPEVIAQAHIFCLPSYREGVPKVLIEAAACGKPIVTTDTPGCREIVKNNINGLLVPVRNAKAVAFALRELLESNELRTQMGKKGRELVVREFTVDKVNDSTLNLYESMLR